MRGEGNQQGRGRGRGWGGGGRGRGRGRGGGGGGSFRGSRGRGGFRGEKPRGPRVGGFNDDKRSRGPQAVGPRLSEIEVGITEFIGKHSGFKAVMKHRFSDFHVNEIDCEGNVVKLTSLEVPIEEHVPVLRHELIPEEVWEKISTMVHNYSEHKKSDIVTSATVENKEKNPGTESAEISDVSKTSEQTVENKEKNPGTESAKISDVSKTSEQTASVSINEKLQSVELDVTDMDKDGRRIIHTCVKSAFKEVNSSTLDRDGKKFVTFSVGKGSRDNRGKWPASRKGEYLHFVVNKRNMDTSETVNLISKKLWMKPSSITFAGTKDKRGVTSQLMCIRRGEPSRLFSLSKGLYNVCLGNFTFKENSLKLGDLKGNQFRIALRFVDGSDEQITTGLESLKNNGFINYYGLQRFGTNIAVPTHSVGKALFLGDWEKAVDLILQPRESFPVLKAALDEWRSSKDAKAALSKLTHSMHSLEECLLQGIAKYGPKDFINALAMVPRNSRLMYLHAYQSLIWNKAVSQRIKEFGLQPVIGDLVLVKSEKESCIEEECVTPEDSSFEVSSEVEIAERFKNQEVQIITEDNIANYKMEDVVLPLPGQDIVYPSNSIGDFMKNLLKEDGLSGETKQHNVKQYMVGGKYRHIIAKVEKLNWEVVHYNDSERDLILGDFEELKGRELKKDEPKDAKYKAIILSMCLEPSTYATMAIREITKTDTSACTQASISAASVPVKDVQSTEDGVEIVTDANNAEKTIEDVQTESASGVKRKLEEASDEEIEEKRLKET